MASIQKTLLTWNIWEIKDIELLTLIIGRNGGMTTMRIIDLLLKRPLNKNQISKLLKLDYKTVTHHIKIIITHDYICEIKIEKVNFYKPSDKLFSSIEEYKLIREHILNEKK
ncbi:MAG: winged helix-turn-helix transcriptional regulator [Methanobrevibacter sp.]|uniref:winged helix-turn-helix domain-containing protein n=1 Tax=Methanobrevibacter sp. TaxID=66852 RepID=UPI0025D87778|nr:winged helix-turn-helix domain-containing protein [Methanobrevibacter sp.]MBQ8017606.1 winged helix-turn-helix transcriptional regulator [Methanobrevibacter sp.]